MQNIDSFKFAGKKAIIRVDFNVPLNEKFEITDDTRIAKSIPTIMKILNDDGAVILMSHLGRPKKGPDNKYSLKHLVSHLSKLVGRDVKFADDCIGDATLKLKKELKPGEVLLLENLRFYPEEEKGDLAFAQKLAEGADVYVNDAFGTAHRAHASTAVIAKFFPVEKMFGYLMENEVVNIEKVLLNPARPFTAIMGGAKVSDKISIIKNLISKVDHLIIGGGMVYTFIKAQGGKIGTSLVEEHKFEVALELLKMAKENNVQIHLPVDNIIADKFDNAANTEYAKIFEGKEGWMGLDIGEESVKKFTDVIMKSKTILWNGPMGVFEMEKFHEGTKKIAYAIVDATKNGAFSLIGGGDSVAAINQFGLADDVSYVSTGGGAMLEFIEGIELPGIKAVRE
jgi:phosphoglycerate kinase